MRRPRHLSQAERDLWDKVARGADPLANKSPQAETDMIGQPEPHEPQKPPARLEQFRVGSGVNHTGDHDLLPSLAEQLGSAAVAMDKKAFGRMKRGKLRPEAKLDLHGMTLAQAHPALASFVTGAHADGKRLVLVITGKGKAHDDDDPIPTRHGVLRHQVPQWLRLPPLSGVVMQVSAAHMRHGGHGAYYVYLRRQR